MLYALGAASEAKVRAVPELRAFRRAAAELEARADALAAEVAESIHERMPEFGRDARVTAQTTAAVRAAITGFSRLIAQQKPVDEPPPPAEVIEYARAYVRRGFPMPLLLRSYRLGHEELWRAWSKQMKAGDYDPEELLELLEVSSGELFAYLDALTGWVVDAYDAERELWANSAAARRLELVTALLAGEQVDLQSAGRTLRYELQRWHLAVVLWTEPDNGADDSTGRLQARAEELAGEFAGGRPLVIHPGRAVSWLWFGGYDQLSPDTVSALAAAAPRSGGVFLAMGKQRHGADGFRRSHEEAMTVRRVLCEAGRSGEASNRYEQVALLGLLTERPEATRSFVQEVLGELAAPRDAESRLRATLSVYLEERLSPLHTAERLNIHVNTVAYRVRQCEEKLGRPVTERRLETEAALRLIAFFGPEWVAGERAT